MASKVARMVSFEPSLHSQIDKIRKEGESKTLLNCKVKEENRNYNNNYEQSEFRDTCFQQIESCKLAQKVQN